MGSRKIQTCQKKAKNLCTIYFVFDLDGKCKLKKYVLLSCHLGWMNRRRFCLQKGGSQEHIALITKNRPKSLYLRLLLVASLVILGYDATASSNRQREQSFVENEVVSSLAVNPGVRSENASPVKNTLGPAEKSPQSKPLRVIYSHSCSVLSRC